MYLGIDRSDPTPPCPPHALAPLPPDCYFVLCCFCAQESMANPEEFSGALKTSLWIIWGEFTRLPGL